jgi:molecular chaperone IbpA
MATGSGGSAGPKLLQIALARPNNISREQPCRPVSTGRFSFGPTVRFRPGGFYQEGRFRPGGLDFHFPVTILGENGRIGSSRPEGAAQAGLSQTQIASQGEFEMSRFDFTPYRRTTVGFDRLFDLLENAGRATNADNYPPFNIERISETEYVVTVAVAGFKPEEIDITAQENLLIVAGKKEVDGNDNRDFLHVGIANRNFERRFQLADHVLVKGADMADGLLLVQLERQVPDALKPRKIAVGGGTASPTTIEHDDAKKKDGKAA